MSDNQLYLLFSLLLLLCFYIYLHISSVESSIRPRVFPLVVRRLPKKKPNTHHDDRYHCLGYYVVCECCLFENYKFFKAKLRQVGV